MVEIVSCSAAATGPHVRVPISEDVRFEWPFPIHATIRTGITDVEVTVVPKTTGVPGWTRVTFDMRGSTGTNEILRAAGIPDVLEEIVGRMGIRYQWDGSEWVCDVDNPHHRVGPAELTAAFKVARRNRIKDEEIEKAAEVYREAVLQQRRDPTMAVAEALDNMPRSTAARRVQLARERGLLGPAKRTYAGEAK